MGLPADRKKLQQAMAQLVAKRKHLDGVRGKVQDRASQQLDTTTHAIKVAGEHVARRKGGILTQRYLKTHLTEAARLRAVTARREGDDHGR